MDPAPAAPSKSSGTSMCSAVNSGVDDPPGVQNFSGIPSFIPPASSSSSRSVVPSRRLVLAGARDVPGQRVDLRAGALLAAHRPEPRAAALHDRRDRGDGLDVVDHGRRGVEARRGRERRLEPRLPAAALQRVEQRRLLAADVGTGAGVHDDVQVEPGAEDVAAQVALRVRLLDRVADAPQRVQRLPADVDRAELRADRVAGDDAALDERVRVRHHRRDVLAGAGLALVRVHDEVLGLGTRSRGPLRDEAPLHARREARAAASPQARRLDQLDQLVRVAGERVPQRGVALQLLVHVDVPGARATPAPREHRCDRGAGCSQACVIASLFLRQVRPGRAACPASRVPPSDGPRRAARRGACSVADRVPCATGEVRGRSRPAPARRS